ncbi:P-loop containing nucleoside triphosphate hydrolase protein [Clavulina sp. PMI_390]|nr:P-loop containing nucleoside triphosphate hydrolase protein [Clavulina sp. PMI_390]
MSQLPNTTANDTQPGSLLQSVFNRDPYLKSTPVGCYELVEEVPSWASFLPGWKLLENAKVFIEDWPFVVRFAIDCSEQGGFWRLFAYICFQFAQSIMPAGSLYFSGRLMNVISDFVKKEAVDQTRFYHAAGSLLLWKVLELQIKTIYKAHVRAPLKRRIDVYFEDLILQAKVRLDLPTYKDPIVKTKFKQLKPLRSHGQGWRIFSEVFITLFALVSMVSELVVLWALLSEEEGGTTFALIAAIRPVIDLLSYSTWSPEVFYTRLVNPAALKIKKLLKLASEERYRKHVVADGLQDYIPDEMARLRLDLGNARTDNPRNILWEQKTPFGAIVSYFSAVSSDLPMMNILCIIFVWTAVWNGSSFPLTSLTLLTNTTKSLGWKIDDVVRSLRDIAGFHTTLRTLYEVLAIENQVKDGDHDYPLSSNDGLGMKIEFKSVSFSYPEEKSQSLDDMSFVIGAGQLCVIVGENGCGKSSTVNLISRAYDATKGEILIDDTPITSFTAKSLRKAQTILYQDFVKYPTSIGENIGFGDVKHISNLSRIRKSAESASALSFIESQSSGFDTRTETPPSLWSSLSRARVDGPLQKQIKKYEEEVSISGGQWQRLAIARSFMRIMSDAEEEKKTNRIKLLIYDEPSSALDPRAEFELFEKLRTERRSRTLIFITHRFGHLTKYADLILYMKDGKILEKGTHAELLALDGGYAQLYNVQAQAFS